MADVMYFTACNDHPNDGYNVDFIRANGLVADLHGGALALFYDAYDAAQHAEDCFGIDGDEAVIIEVDVRGLTLIDEPSELGLRAPHPFGRHSFATRDLGLDRLTFPAAPGMAP